jgi:hypothetical protein
VASTSLSYCQVFSWLSPRGRRRRYRSPRCTGTGAG